MIEVDKINATLTKGNLRKWIAEWEKDSLRLSTNFEMYENRKNGEAVVKLPFAKKLVITSTSAALGDGVTITAGELDDGEQKTFDELQRLFKQQTPLLHDRKIIKDGCIAGRGYELIYMSNDEVPIPKLARLHPLNTFVVFDDTVEHNSLYAVSFKKITLDNKTSYKVTVYDSTTIYESELQQDTKITDLMTLENGRPHNLGRVPVTEYHNNVEEQGDFEQVISLIEDRSTLHTLNLNDSLAIAKNYLTSKGIAITGKTQAEKDASQLQMAQSQRIELPVEAADGTYIDVEDMKSREVALLSKNENYASITEYGSDIDQKIYSLSLIPDVADEQFAGNQSGVAIEHKYMPLKQLCAEKDEEIEKLYRRRLKIYIHALQLKGFAPIDLSKIDISIVRVWSKVENEIAQTIATLKATGLPFSDKKLMEMFPSVDYDTEMAQRENEAEAQPETKNNGYMDWLSKALQQPQAEEQTMPPEEVANDNGAE